MASGRITIPIGLETTGVQKGATTAEKALKDLEDATQDAGRSGARSLDKIEDELKDVQKATKKAATTAGKELPKGFKEGADEAKSEIASSGKEAAASFGGGFDDVADLVQEAVANAFAGFGPVGAAAGIAVAAAIGTVLAQAQAAQEKLAEAREAAAGLARTMYENGGTLPIEDAVDSLFDTLSKEVRPNGPLQSMLDGFVDLGTNIDAVKTAARVANTPLQTMIRGLSGGDLDDTAASITAVKKALKDLNDEANTGARSNTEIVGEESQLKSILTDLETIQAQSEIAEEALGAVSSAYPKVSDEDRKNVEDLSTAWGNAAVNVGNYVHAGEEGIKLPEFDVEGFISDWDSNIAKANEFKQELLGVPPEIRDEAMRLYKESGIGAADIFLDGYVQAAPANQKRLVDILGTAGTAAGAAAGTGLIDAADGVIGAWVPPSVGVKISPDTAAWDAAVARIEAWDPNKTIDITPRIQGTRQPV